MLTTSISVLSQEIGNRSPTSRRRRLDGPSVAQARILEQV
jgi:hypothetical protein